MRRILFIFSILILAVTDIMSQSMDWLCRPGEYSDIQYMGCDLFKVKSAQGKWGIMHADGNLLIDTSFDSITGFKENRALILDNRGKRLQGIVDPSGHLIKDFSKENISVSRYPYFKEGRLVAFTKDGLYGYLNELGLFVIEPQFYFAAPFQNGIAAVQYANTDYGLINKAGRSVIVSDEHYPYISNPVDGKVLVIRGSRKGGDQLAVMRIEGTNLKRDKVLEDGMNIWLSDDFTTIECQLGHTYHIDNQWRVSGSSHNVQLPKFTQDPPTVVTENTTVLSKVEAENGEKITYLGNPILDFPFQHVSTFDKSYAIVRSKGGKIAALKLNPSATITIKATQPPVIFHHNELRDVILDVSLVDVDPSKIKWYRNDQGWLTHSQLEQKDGVWKLRMPYFRSAVSYGYEANDTVDIAITYDGLDWIHQSVEVKSTHAPGYEVEVTGSDIAGENGKATLNILVRSLNSNGVPKGFIRINGGNPIKMDNKVKTIPINVIVPEGMTKSFSYIVEINEEGCPPFSTKVTKNVSNSQRKQKETKTEGKKKIIIQ